MSVHNTPYNSVHNTPHNFDDEDVKDPAVTLISKLDLSHPLHLRPNDFAALIIVSMKLKGAENYQVWSCAMLLALEGKNKTSFIDGSCVRSKTDEVLGRQWDRVNVIKQFDALVELPRCTCHVADGFKKHNQLMKLMQFLMGLNDTYMQIRSYILSRETLPDVRIAYAIISNEESHRIASVLLLVFLMNNYLLLSLLLKENSINGKGVHANMADSGANQHITFTDKFLTNVIDISHLKTKVSHHNGTEAFITKIGNMPLTDYLTLFDVLVVHEYYVSLMSVHKVARDSKLIIAFDELKCYILNQDLKVEKVLGTGRQFGGLYYFDGNEVLNVLRPNLLFENDKSDVMCDICQRAKQTREPFPLSDHVSTEIGDLVHLDLWGPYKERSDLIPNSYGTPSPHSGSIFEPLNESEGGHSQGSKVVASEEERSANYEDNQNIISEGNGPLFSRQNDQDISETQNLWSFKPKSFEEAAKHQPWVDAINSEMDALYRNNTWDLVDLPKGRKAIGFNQREGIDFDKTFSPVVKIVTVRYLINLAVQNGWTLYQMDVNNAFLNGDLNETVYMALPPGYFPKDKTKVCKLNKSLYVLKHALRQWNVKLTSALIECGFVQSKSDYSLFTKNEPKDDDLLLENVTDYQKLIGKLIYLTTTRPDIAYTISCLSQFMHNPLKSHLKTALKVIRLARCTNTKRFVTGFCIFMNESLVSWKNKNQNTISKSSTEAEYRALASMTSEVISVHKILKDLECSNMLPVKVFCDNNSAIKIAANPIFHERTKHLEIDLHFVRDKILVGVIKTEKIDTANQIADILTKGLDIKQHNLLCSKLNLVGMFENKIKGGC
ncbi:ribonuclease H-like domain-containing protein [Tanacetum coccineum]